jgi:transposase-like protein
MSMLKIYTDENAAREHLESLHWPDGPICPRCGTVNEATKLTGKSTRPGVYKCRPCQKPFTVTVGTVFERSKIKLNVWVHAVDLYTASKKGFSAHQLHRTMGVTYKTAWFMAHRIREAMRDDELAPMGGAGSIVEVDETFIGRLEGQPKRTKGWGHKNTVLTLVERGGSARSFHIDSTSIAQIVPILRENIRRESSLMTDEARQYMEVGREFESHDAVNHGEKEYVRYWNTVTGTMRPDGKPLVQTTTITTNTVEGYYSIFKRGMKGIYQHCSEKHLHRYLAEFDFRYSNRIALGCNDTMRAEKAMQGARGKRLMYRRAGKAELY